MVFLSFSLWAFDLVLYIQQLFLLIPEAEVKSRVQGEQQPEQA